MARDQVEAKDVSQREISFILLQSAGGRAENQSPLRESQKSRFVRGTGSILSVKKVAARGDVQ
jgi:hypothetical protein